MPRRAIRRARLLDEPRVLRQPDTVRTQCLRSDAARRRRMAKVFEFRNMPSRPAIGQECAVAIVELAKERAGGLDIALYAAAGELDPFVGEGLADAGHAVRMVVVQIVGAYRHRVFPWSSSMKPETEVLHVRL